MSSTQVSVHVKINGQEITKECEVRTLLAYFLREQLGLTGVHVGCDTTSCGACTVLLDGKTAIKSCTVFAPQVDGHELLTVEGLGEADHLHPIQQAFWDCHALQCGYCTPGMELAVLALLQRNPNPTDEEIRFGLSGNLCRCTGYKNIVKAVHQAAEIMNHPSTSQSVTL
ncbi:MAG: (2Fe-2S)-binding protein [Firmicutes bacterium]|nr:(2Fe-2S)-binding protein [Bacillota bacterium]